MHNISIGALIVLTAFIAGTLLGCNGQQETTNLTDGNQTAAQDTADFDAAVASLQPASGEDVSGTVLFIRTNDGIRIEADVQGLEEGEHGFHVHQYGDCTADDLTSAGGHYNPLNAPHGAPDDEQRHVGDMGNLEANADGMATYSRVDSVISFSGERSILGRAVIVHGGADDLESQPSGDAGPRMACGVIGVANPETTLE